MGAAQTPQGREGNLAASLEQGVEIQKERAGVGGELEA